VGRAALYGEPVMVKVADRRAAEVFRLALVRSASERSTDRLVRVVVSDK
jgi:hypothetical protein